MIKNLIVLLVFVSATLLAQERIEVLSTGEYFPGVTADDLPGDVPSLLFETFRGDTLTSVVVARIESQRPKLGPDNSVVKQYQATVLSTLRIGTALLEPGASFEFEQSGGALFTGTRLLVGTHQFYAEIENEGSYLLFLRKVDGAYKLVMGKYGAFQVIGGYVLPCARDSEGYRRYAGLRLEDFCHLIENGI